MVMKEFSNFIGKTFDVIYRVSEHFPLTARLKNFLKVIIIKLRQNYSYLFRKFPIMKILSYKHAYIIRGHLTLSCSYGIRKR
jgi:hypothetical protein